MTDPIADMLTRIKNGYLARLSEVEVPYSKVKEALCRVLKQHGFIGEFQMIEKERKLVVTLVYHHGVPALTDVERMSKPGLRRYVGRKALNKLQHRLGHVIVSTSKGIKTLVEAKELGIGGEVVCRVW